MYQQHLHCNVKNDESDLKKCMTSNQLHVHLCNKYSYFIHTEIYTVRYYHSWLWLDKRCIFGSSLPTSQYKSRYEQNKCIIPWKVFEQFLFFSCNTSKNSLFCCIHLLGFFTALQLVNKNCSCTPSLDKYLRTLTCTYLNWVTWKVGIWERKKRNSLLYVQYINLIPPVTKTEFLLTISIQYQADK